MWDDGQSPATSAKLGATDHELGIDAFSWQKATTASFDKILELVFARESGAVPLSFLCPLLTVNGDEDRHPSRFLSAASAD